MRALFLALIAFTFLQCQENCEPPFDKSAIVKFMNYDTKKAFPDSIVFKQVFGVGSPFMDTTLRANNTFKLPLNPKADSVVYQFISKNNAKVYSAIIRYKRTPEIRNPDCGVQMQYSDLNARTFLQIDSIATGNTFINENSSQPNFVFYIKP